jgi:predicted transcriptional regulator
MTDNKPKKPIMVLRERCGGMSDELKAYQKELNALRKQLTATLQEGPKTVPEIAQACGLETDKALWHLMAMKRYGAVGEKGQKGDYYLYGLEG